MRRPLDYDDIIELEVSAGSAEEHLAAADRLRGWGEQTHPADDDVTPADLLVAAANHLRWAGQERAALDTLREAVLAEGNAPPDTRCHLHAALLDAGCPGDADEVAHQLRRSRPTEGSVYLMTGENYEGAGDLDAALRWLTMGLVRVERGSVLETGIDRLMLRNGRYRVRRALGLPPDDLDDEAAADIEAAADADVDGTDGSDPDGEADIATLVRRLVRGAGPAPSPAPSWASRPRTSRSR